MKLDGKSNNAIIEYLNGNGILSPSEYKKKLNSNYNLGIKKNKESLYYCSKLFFITTQSTWIKYNDKVITTLVLGYSNVIYHRTVQKEKPIVQFL